MVSIPKVVGVLSCGFLLCLGLSTAAQADEMKSGQDSKKGEQDKLKKDDMKAGQSARKGGQAGVKGEEDKSKGVDMNAVCPDAGRGRLEGAVHLGRNHYDRLVHFCFGFLLAYPIEELFRLAAYVRGWLLYYLPVMTILGLSGLWEIIESWVARAVHPEAGIAYLGSQGDVWDAQKDMEAALYGALLCVILLLLSRAKRRWASTSQPSELVGT